MILSREGQQEAAVEDQGLPGHERCAIRTHPYHRFGDFRRSSKTADEMATNDIFVDSRSAKEPLAHSRFDYSGAHGVNPNPTISIF